MKKKPVSKLVLSRESLRILNHAELAVGAAAEPATREKGCQPTQPAQPGIIIIVDEIVQ